MRRALPIAAAGVIAAAVISLAVWGLKAMVASDARDMRDQAKAMQRANVICGRPPARIIVHNAGWSYGRWIEVRCADGTVRAVR